MCLAASLALGGCPSSGSNGTGLFLPGFTIPTVPVVTSASSFETAEFSVNTGLDQVDAQSAYSRGGTGQGVTVAVIDTGVDPTHPDLDDNLSAQPIDIVSPLTPISDTDGHGTLVSGVIGAEKNGTDGHGIAFDVEILPIRADAICGTPPCGFTDTAISNGIDFAIASGAKVINLSLGGGSSTTVLRNAMVRAAEAGVIVVVAAGNSGGLSPVFPAAYAGDSGMLGHLVAVAAVDDTNTIASFSNMCGTGVIAAFCLSAPGVDIETTAVGGGMETVSGTSFSAPHVAGAAAILLQLFPTLSAAQIVQILLQTATALGNSAVFGHGLLNLMAATTPQGLTTVPLSTALGGASASLGESALRLGPAFGDALNAATLLNRTVFVDALGRPFGVDLGGLVSRPARPLGLEDAIAHKRYRSVPLPPVGGLSLGLGFSEAESGADPVDDPWREKTALDSYEVADFNLSMDVSERTRLGFAIDASPTRLMHDGGQGPVPDGLFWASHAFFSPAAALAGPGIGLGMQHGIDARTRLSVLTMTSRRDGADEEAGVDGGSAHTVAARVDRVIADNARLAAGFGVTREGGGVLGAVPTGAFGEADATTRFVSAEASVPLWGRTTAFAGLTLGWTDVAEKGPAVIGDWSTIRSMAFAAGLSRRDALAMGDRLGFLVGQPLRIDSAYATLSVPTAVFSDGTVRQESARTALGPTGRELDFQLAYDYEIGAGANLASWLMMRLQPGHVADAAPDFGLGIRLRLAL